MTKDTIRLAGAQIPVGTNIQANKKEILKALDWAKENEVIYLSTPEGSLSGYANDWVSNLDELRDAEKEVKNHQRKCGVNLFMGTCFREEEPAGLLNRNMIRFYNSWDTENNPDNLPLMILKTYCIPHDNCIRRNADQGIQSFFIPSGKDFSDGMALKCAGMICNDMWGAIEEDGTPLNELLINEDLDLIFHVTNGIKFSPTDKRQESFDAYHNGFLRMTALKTLSTIVTVDSCTTWWWDGNEEDVDYCITSSESGVLDFTGWKTNVPRTGRQYFYHDYLYKVRGRERFDIYDRELRDDPEYASKLWGKFNAESNHSFPYSTDAFYGRK
tara:strand:+ start:2640 stop:3626 length:987 start_codon:yes stop_codon:yes gene_type:complete